MNWTALRKVLIVIDKHDKIVQTGFGCYHPLRIGVLVSLNLIISRIVVIIAFPFRISYVTYCLCNFFRSTLQQSHIPDEFMTITSLSFTRPSTNIDQAGRIRAFALSNPGQSQVTSLQDQQSTVRCNRASFSPRPP